jgi:hypothetical protein
LGASDASELSDDPDSDSESERQQKADAVKMMKLAEQALWDYAKSFPNGMLDV